MGGGSFYFKRIPGYPISYDVYEVRDEERFLGIVGKPEGAPARAWYTRPDTGFMWETRETAANALRELRDEESGVYSVPDDA